MSCLLVSIFSGTQAADAHMLHARVKVQNRNLICFCRRAGLAHLEGYGVEKNGRVAYYWLRMAEENSSAVRQRSLVLTEELRTGIGPAEIQVLERSIAARARSENILASKPLDLFKQRRLPLPTDRRAV
jgi:hypothetical protein